MVFRSLTALFVLGVICASSVLLTGCATTGSKNNDMTLNDLYRHMNKETGCQFFSTANPGPMHAQDGIAVSLENHVVFFYKFDIERTKQRPKWEYVKENKQIYLFGKSLPAVVNGSFIMVDYENNPKKEELLKAFDSFSK